MALTRFDLSTFRSEQIEQLLKVFSDGSKTLNLNITGDLTGDVTGDVTGDLSGLLKLPVKTYEADGAADETKGVHILDGSSATVDLTWTAPKAGEVHLFYCSDSTNDATITLAAGTFDGTNEIATFADDADWILVVGLSATRFLVLVNNGSVAFSTAA